MTSSEFARRAGICGTCYNFTNACYFTVNAPSFRISCMCVEKVRAKGTPSGPLASSLLIAPTSGAATSARAIQDRKLQIRPGVRSPPSTRGQTRPRGA